MFNVYHHKLLLPINDHAPYMTLFQKEIKLKFKPWITKSVLINY